MSDSPPGNSKRSRSRAKGAICFETEIDGERPRVRLTNDVDLSLEEFATRSAPDGYEYADPLPTYPVPATGTQDPSCGKAISPRFCNRCAIPDTVGRTCRCVSCPRCWQAWEFWRAHAIASKLASLNWARRVERAVYYHHLVVSFRASTRFRSADPEARAADAAKLLLQRLGIDTGVLLYHPYSIVPEYNTSHPEYDGSYDPVAWKDVLTWIERDKISWSALRKQFLRYNPHFHVFTVAGEIPTKEHTTALEKRTGVLVRRLASRRSDGKTRSIANEAELCRALVSELTHIGVSTTETGSQRAAYRYFGELHNDKATPGALGHMAETLREVAPPILGVEFPPRECRKQVETTGACDPLTCGGQLCSIEDAQQYLADELWLAAVGERVVDSERRLAALRRACTAWNGDDRQRNDGEVLGFG